MNEVPSESGTEVKGDQPKIRGLADLQPFIVYEACTKVWRITCPTRFTNYADALAVASKLNALLSSSAEAWRDV